MVSKHMIKAFAFGDRWVRVASISEAHNLSRQLSLALTIILIR